ncbi:MAG: PepSY-associated TM helix domain-containing protein [Bacteroidales bacterium]
MNKRAKRYLKWHKWPGLILAAILLYMSISGILMNHRSFIGGVDVNRKALPTDYHYHNWNLAAIKGIEQLSADSLLLYGNIGIWLTDSAFTRFESYAQGFEKGIDNRKIFDVHKTANGNLYAASLFGLYVFDTVGTTWVRLPIEATLPRFVGLESRGDTLYAMNRSYLFQGLDKGTATSLKRLELQAPEGYKQEVTLFKTLWQIHSGEIFGLPGKLFVDFLGVVSLLLSITGIFYFVVPGWMKRRKRKGKEAARLAATNRWALKWHNKAGTWLFVFLLILFASGMFLRPPLLIAIGNSRVRPIPFSHLHQSNPWHDKFRDILYDTTHNHFILASSDGLFFLEDIESTPQKFQYQPPVSVMGITVLKPFKQGAFLIGSFSGLFLWHPAQQEVLDFAEGTLYKESIGGRPVGNHVISGAFTDNKGNWYGVDYNQGVKSLYHKEEFPSMPLHVKKASPMSLWNLSLELHTGRIFSALLGDFYILLVPLIGLLALIVTISGYLLWRARSRKKGVR